MASLHTILLADDDPHFRDNVAGLLDAKGFSVLSASDGVEALRSIRQHHPDLAILGLLLLKIDAGRVCRLIRQDRKLRHMPIIAVSPLNLEDTKHYPELNADALVAKRAWRDAAEDLLEAIEYLNKGHFGLMSGVFGFQRFRPAKLPTDLLSARRHYEALLRRFSFGVLELDASGHILMVNATAATVLNARESSLIGQPLQDHLPEQDRQALGDVIRSAAGAASSEEHRLPISLDTAATVLSLHSTIENGRCTGFLVTLE